MSIFEYIYPLSELLSENTPSPKLKNLLSKIGYFDIINNPESTGIGPQKLIGSA